MRGNWQWWVMAVVAGYGALLSTYNAYAARKQSTRQVKVTVRHGFLTFGPNLSDLMLIVSASNPGQRAVTLTSVGFSLPDKSSLVLMSSDGTQLPHELTEGTGCTHWIPIREMAQQLQRKGFSGNVKFTAFYLDAVDVRHSSEPFSFNIREWL
jgi:hypothetical protein